MTYTMEQPLSINIVKNNNMSSHSCLYQPKFLHYSLESPIQNGNGKSYRSCASIASGAIYPKFHPDVSSVNHQFSVLIQLVMLNLYGVTCRYLDVLN